MRKKIMIQAAHQKLLAAAKKDSQKRYTPTEKKPGAKKGGYAPSTKETRESKWSEMKTKRDEKEKTDPMERRTRKPGSKKK